MDAEAVTGTGIGPRRALRHSVVTRGATDVDRRVQNLICANRSYGLRRTGAVDIVRRVTVVRSACRATADPAVCRAMEVRAERPAMAEAVALRAEAVDIPAVGGTSEAAVEVDTPVVAGAAMEAGDTARSYELY